jgi:hypothetical protein
MGLFLYWLAQQDYAKH